MLFDVRKKISERRTIIYKFKIRYIFLQGL